MDDANLYDEIVSVARELYEKSGRVEGHDLENWLEAERIVRARYATKENNTSEAVETINMKYIEDERSVHDSSYSKIINIGDSRAAREITKKLEREESIKRLLLLRKNEKICLKSLDLFETELKMIDEELHKASNEINQKKTRLSEIERELIILNSRKNNFDHRKKIAASISLFSFLIFIGMFIWYFKPIAFLFGFLFSWLAVYSSFNYLNSHKLESFVSKKKQENTKLITDLEKLRQAELFCKNKHNQKVDMIEKQRTELEAIATKISDIRRSIVASEEKEKIHYEIFEQDRDNILIEEKRKYERSAFVKPIKYSLRDTHGEISALIPGKGVSVDISEGGLGMITDYALKKGDILFFEEEIKINKITPIASLVKWTKEIERNKYRAGLVFSMVCS